jgi:hypothetical protein
MRNFTYAAELQAVGDKIGRKSVSVERARKRRGTLDGAVIDA